jgi:small redox-active disulfide protein 2
VVIEVLGPGCPNCKKLFSLVEQAVKDLGLQAKLEKITDINVIAGYGVMRTPGIAVDGVVKISGRVPKLEEIKTILQGVK